MSFIRNIFTELKNKAKVTPEEERAKLEKAAVKKYFDKDKTDIYYIAQQEVRGAISMEHTEAATRHAIHKLKNADRLQKAYEDGISDLRKQFLGMPTTQWYIDYDLDYPNSRKD